MKIRIYLWVILKSPFTLLLPNHGCPNYIQIKPVQVPLEFAIVPKQALLFTWSAYRASKCPEAAISPRYEKHYQLMQY